MAERIGHLTRFPSLTLGVNIQRGQRSLSWTGSGVLIPCEEKASDVFKRMFVQGSKEETEAQMRKLELGKSILDAVADQAKDLQRSVGPRDRNRLDQYFTSVRELELRIALHDAAVVVVRAKHRKGCVVCGQPIAVVRQHLLGGLQQPHAPVLVRSQHLQESDGA